MLSSDPTAGEAGRPYPFTNLVFEGGGVKGIAYAGALQVLQTAGILAGVTAFAGTSAGAITAALAASGHTAEELTETMLSLDLTQFEDGGWEGPARLVERFGWYRGDSFRVWIGAQLEAKLGSATATFGDLADSRGVELFVVASDLCDQTPHVFSTVASPDMAVAEAVRMSMSIPFYFAAVSTDGSLFVDGGATWNYPVEIFDGAEANPATLGFRFEPSAPRGPVRVDNLVEFAKHLYESVLMVQTDFYQRSEADRHRTVVIDDLGIRATDFAISREQKQALLDNGIRATEAYLTAYSAATAGGAGATAGGPATPPRTATDGPTRR